MEGAHKNFNGSRDRTTPLSGMVCDPWATVNLPKKFEVSIYTHYEDMKGNTKCRNGVICGS